MLFQIVFTINPKCCELGSASAEQRAGSGQEDVRGGVQGAPIYTRQIQVEHSFLTSFLSSFLASFVVSFLASFLPIFLPCLVQYSFLPLYFPSVLHSWLPSLHPSFKHFFLPVFLPTFHFFLSSFLLFISFIGPFKRGKFRILIWFSIFMICKEYFIEEPEAWVWRAGCGLWRGDHLKGKEIERFNVYKKIKRFEENVFFT